MQESCTNCQKAIPQGEYTFTFTLYNGRLHESPFEGEPTHFFCRECAMEAVLTRKVVDRSPIEEGVIGDLWWLENSHGSYYKATCYVGVAALATVYGFLDGRITWKLHFNTRQEKASEFTVSSGIVSAVSKAKIVVEREIRDLLKELQTQGVDEALKREQELEGHGSKIVI